MKLNLVNKAPRDFSELCDLLFMKLQGQIKPGLVIPDEYKIANKNVR